jgi:hypothetical protein
MKNEINFLKHYRKKVEVIKGKDKKPFQTAIIFFIVMLFILGISIFTKKYFQEKLDILITEKTNLENKVRAKQEEEQDLINFYAKFKMISEILIKRYDGVEKVGYVSDMNGDNLQIKEIDYQLYDRFISVVAETDTIFTLDGLIKEFDKPEIKNNFSKIKKDSLTRLSNGKYQLMLKFYLKDFKE